MSVLSDIAIAYEMRKRARYHAAAGAGLGVFAVLALLALLHEQIAPFAIGANGAGPPLTPPGPMHPFGTDILGRDVWSEAVHGLRFTLSAALAAFAIAFGFGAFLGRVVCNLAGLLGRAVRVGVNVLASVPSILLAVLFAAIIGPENLALAAGAALTPAAFIASFDRAERHRNAPYAEYARASGVSDMTLLRRELVHWLRASAIAEAALLFTIAVILVSTVSFFGFGAQPPSRDLGLVIASARSGLGQAWWTGLGPAILLVALIASARIAGGLTGGAKE